MSSPAEKPTIKVRSQKLRSFMHPNLQEVQRQNRKNEKREERETHAESGTDGGAGTHMAHFACECVHVCDTQ